MADETTEVEETEAEVEAPKRLTQKGELYEGKVKGKTVRFKVVKNRPSLVWDVLQYSLTNPLFAEAAAIGLYMFGLDKPEACGLPYTNALEFGSRVADDLYLGGWRPKDIQQIGKELIAIALSTLPKIQEEDEADPLG